MPCAVFCELADGRIEGRIGGVNGLCSAGLRAAGYREGGLGCSIRAYEAIVNYEVGERGDGARGIVGESLIGRDLRGVDELA